MNNRQPSGDGLIRTAARTTRVVHVSTFPPLKCGIASFASDLIGATPGLEHARYALHYGQQNVAPPDVGAVVSSADSLAELARVISASDCDVVCLQHEFGIWGGSEGEYIDAFLDQLTKPLLSVLHTTFMPGARSHVQSDIIRRLVGQSACVVVLTNKSKDAVEALCGHRIAKLVAVPHGIPSFPYATPPSHWQSNINMDRPLQLVTLGFYREDKGLEVILCALKDIRNRGFDVRLRLAGEPQGQFCRQAAYQTKIEDLIRSLDLTSVVEIDSRYLTVPQQIACIQQSHLGIFAYQDASHASSGTVPLVMGAGRPVLCTPFEYAKAKAEEGPGVFLSDCFDADSISSSIERFIGQTERDYEVMTEVVFQGTRSWQWSVVGQTFTQLLSACAQSGNL